jgi:hypothetical protein
MSVSAGQPPAPCSTFGLLQVGSDRIEHRVEVRTDELHGHDDGYRDTSGDKAILNSGGTRFVLCETSDQFHVRRSC